MGGEILSSIWYFDSITALTDESPRVIERSLYYSMRWPVRTKLAHDQTNCTAPYRSRGNQLEIRTQFPGEVMADKRQLNACIAFLLFTCQYVGACPTLCRADTWNTWPAQDPPSISEKPDISHCWNCFFSNHSSNREGLGVSKQWPIVINSSPRDIFAPDPHPSVHPTCTRAAAPAIYPPPSMYLTTLGHLSYSIPIPQCCYWRGASFSRGCASPERSPSGRRWYANAIEVDHKPDRKTT